MRGKIQDLNIDDLRDQQLRDTDAKRKAKSKQHADSIRGARYSKVEIGDKVILPEEKMNKLSTRVGTDLYKVVNKEGNSLILEDEE